MMKLFSTSLFSGLFSLLFLACDFTGSPFGEAARDAATSAPDGLGFNPPEGVDAPDQMLTTTEAVSLEAGAYLLSSNLDDESLSCWNTRPQSGGYNRTGCGVWKNIGGWPLTLAENSVRRGTGSKSIRIQYTKNEEAGGANVGVYTDAVNVRSYFYFYPGFDFGQGMKIGRVSSFNSATQVNDIDIILQTRSASGTNQCGTNDMKDLGIHFNGRPLGYDWGSLSIPISFARGRWYAVEYQVVLNTPGVANGSVRIWVDGLLKGEKRNLNIRGTAGSGTKLNSVKIGGLYSNSAYGNPCPNPATASRYYMDDVVISQSYIGL